MPSVAIFGAGIAGLTAAHELAERKWEVHLFERGTDVGGVARSARTEPGNVPTEYSWRVVFSYYDNLRDILGRIPSGGDTVADQLNTKGMSINVCQDRSTKAPSTISWTREFMQNPSMGLGVARTLVANRRCPDLAAQSIGQYGKPGANVIMDSLGTYLGFDPSRTSVYHVGKVASLSLNARTLPMQVLRGPSSEVWFAPWLRHLTIHLGVIVHFRTRLHSLQRHSSGDAILCATTEREDGAKKTVCADHYILAMDAFAVRDVLYASVPMLDDPELRKLPPLTQDGEHLQIGCCIAWKEHIATEPECTAVILADSEWNIIIYNQDCWWDAHHDLGEGVRTLWSATACVCYRAGPLTGLPASHATRQQFEFEVLEQMWRCKQLDAMVRRKNKGRSLRDFPVHAFRVWHGWQFPNEAGQPGSYTLTNRKWVTSVKSEPHRPNAACPTLRNLALAGAYTKTTTNIYSMEGAAESGKAAARVVLLRAGNSANGVELYTHRTTIPVLRGLTRIDDGFHAIGLPSIVDVMLWALLALTVMLVVRAFW